ncbi:MAG: hypothetical protein M1321_02800 [Candidatus Marsarchaeota archaeon]|nr:hypothetical protein [Candidatus Marsarchaeota archaeon]
MAIALNTNRAEHSTDSARAGDYENSMLRKVVRDGWRKGLQEHQKSDGTVEAIELHAGRMGRVLNTAEYEAFCIPSIVEHRKYMSLVELRNYLQMMERIGGLYKRKYGKELAGLLMIGLSRKARDASCVAKYLDAVTDTIKRRSSRHMRLSDKEAAELRAISARRYLKGRSIWGRLFGRGEIALLDAAITEKKERIRRHSRNVARYTGMLNGSDGKPSDGSH